MLRVTFRPFLSALAIIVVVVSVSLDADTIRGELVKTEGEVNIVDVRGVRHSVERYGVIVRELDSIETTAGGKAVVRFTDGTLSVMDQNSRIRVEKTGWLSHLGGKIYFTFKKVFGDSRQVKTRFATLGIRGTTFIVTDDEGGQSVALAEGLLDIETPGADFEIHRHRQLDQFRAYNQQAQEQQQATKGEFDDYKRQLGREFIEYKASFSLQPNHIVRFDGHRVDEALIDDEIKAEFEYFEAIAGELLDEFREEQAYGHEDQPEP